MDVVQILRKLVSFNTVEDKENKEIVEWLGIYLDSLGFENKTFTDEKSGKINLLSAIGSDPAITFSGHIDTVPDSDRWTINPFELIEEGNKLYGLGSCDMKGGIAAFLAVAGNIDKSRLKRGFNLLFTYDEEVDFMGVIDFIKKGHKLSKYVIIPEPSRMKIVAATKGFLGFRVKFKGVSVHSSEPDRGKSAILAAADFITKLNDYGQELRQETDYRFNIPYATSNIGTINGGDAVNKVPAECVIGFEFRTIKKEQTQIITDKINQLAKGYDCEVISDLKIDAMNCEDEEFVKIVKDISNLDIDTFNGVTEASYLQKEGYSILLLGPGPMNAHVADEFVNRDDLYNLTEIFEKLIEHYCY